MIQPASLLRLPRKITLPRDVVASDPNSRDKATRQYAGPLFLLVGQNRNRQEVGAEARTFFRRDTSCIMQTGIVFLIVHYSESGAGLKPALCNMSKSAVWGELLKVIAKLEIAISLIHMTLFYPWRKLCWHPLIWITSVIHATCSVMLVDFPTNMNRQQDAFRKKHVNVSGKIFVVVVVLYLMNACCSLWLLYALLCFIYWLWHCVKVRPTLPEWIYTVYGLEKVVVTSIYIVAISQWVHFGISALQIGFMMWHSSVEHQQYCSSLIDFNNKSRSLFLSFEDSKNSLWSLIIAEVQPPCFVLLRQSGSWNVSGSACSPFFENSSAVNSKVFFCDRIITMIMIWMTYW